MVHQDINDIDDSSPGPFGRPVDGKVVLNAFVIGKIFRCLHFLKGFLNVFCRLPTLNFELDL